MEKKTNWAIKRRPAPTKALCRQGRRRSPKPFGGRARVLCKCCKDRLWKITQYCPVRRRKCDCRNNTCSQLRNISGRINFPESYSSYCTCRGRPHDGAAFGPHQHFRCLLSVWRLWSLSFGERFQACRPWLFTLRGRPFTRPLSSFHCAEYRGTSRPKVSLHIRVKSVHQLKRRQVVDPHEDRCGFQAFLAAFATGTFPDCVPPLIVACRVRYSFRAWRTVRPEPLPAAVRKLGAFEGLCK